MNTRAIGKIAEIKVINYLKKYNFEIIKHNYFSQFGEIDIITKKNNSYHFIEVKSISSSYINPLYKLNKTKRKKIFKTSLDFITKINYKNENLEYYIFIVKNNEINYYRFDIDKDISNE